MWGWLINRMDKFVGVNGGEWYATERWDVKLGLYPQSGVTRIVWTATDGRVGVWSYDEREESLGAIAEGRISEMQASARLPLRGTVSCEQES